MLALRLAIFAGLGGLALWGLFSLLDTLREPQLLRSARTVIVKGCEPVESEQAKRLCPQLFCQKALLDARTLPLRSKFEVRIDAHSGAQRLIAGLARADEADNPQHFACTIAGNQIVTARLIDAAQLQTLSAQAGAANP